MTSKYVFFIVEPDWKGLTGDPDYDWDAAWAEHDAFTDAVRATGGTVVGGDALEPPTSAFRVDRVAEGEPLFTDGPFAESREIISGYYSIELPDGVDVRPIAALCPTDGWVVVHPVAELPDPS